MTSAACESPSASTRTTSTTVLGIQTELERSVGRGLPPPHRPACARPRRDHRSGPTRWRAAPAAVGRDRCRTRPRFLGSTHSRRRRRSARRVASNRGADVLSISSAVMPCSKSHSISSARSARASPSRPSSSFSISAWSTWSSYPMLMPLLHGFPPVVDNTAGLLILGSFPSVLSLESRAVLRQPAQRVLADHR